VYQKAKLLMCFRDVQSSSQGDLVAFGRASPHAVDKVLHPGMACNANQSRWIFLMSGDSLPDQRALASGAAGASEPFAPGLVSPRHSSSYFAKCSFSAWKSRDVEPLRCKANVGKQTFRKSEGRQSECTVDLWNKLQDHVACPLAAISS
jgi:hypothetical protein